MKLTDVHICTSETFMIGAFKIESYCPVCCKENQKIRCGWIECACGGCGNYFDIESLNRIVEKRRVLLGLSRKQIGEKMGLSVKTIAKYENYWPSKKYWDGTKELVIKCLK